MQAGPKKRRACRAAHRDLTPRCYSQPAQPHSIPSASKQARITHRALPIRARDRNRQPSNPIRHIPQPNPTQPTHGPTPFQGPTPCPPQKPSSPLAPAAASAMPSPRKPSRPAIASSVPCAPRQTCKPSHSSTHPTPRRTAGPHRFRPQCQSDPGILSKPGNGRTQPQAQTITTGASTLHIIQTP